MNTFIYHTHPHIGHSKGTTVQWSITPGKIKISEFPVNIKRLLHDIFHIGPGISPRLPYQARQRSWRADMGRGLIPGPYGKFHVIIFLSHILHWPFPSIDFYIAKKIYELTNCENKSLIRVAFVQLANIFVSNLVSKIYQTMSICTMTLETVCKIYLRRWHLNGNSYSVWRIYLS